MIRIRTRCRAVSLMARIRFVEEDAERYTRQDEVPTHCIGQEVRQWRLCPSYRHDRVLDTPLPRALPREGGDVKRMIAEMYGGDGCAKGRGGSMHLIDVIAVRGRRPSCAVYAAFGGAALAFQMRERRGRLFGDAAVEPACSTSA